MDITKSEFARRTGVTRQNVDRWIKRGIIRPNRDGRIDSDRGFKDLEKYLDPSRRIASRERKPDWATGNEYRDLQIMTVLHFHEWVTNQMTPVLIKLLKALHPNNDVLAKSIVVLDSIKRGELVKEYLTEGVLEKEARGSLGDGTLPKNLDVSFPESIMNLLKDRKVHNLVFGEE